MNKRQKKKRLRKALKADFIIHGSYIGNTLPSKNVIIHLDETFMAQERGHRHFFPLVKPAPQG